MYNINSLKKSKLVNCFLIKFNINFYKRRWQILKIQFMESFKNSSLFFFLFLFHFRKIKKKMKKLLIKEFKSSFIYRNRDLWQYTQSPPGFPYSFLFLKIIKINTFLLFKLLIFLLFKLLIFYYYIFNII